MSRLRASLAGLCRRTHIASGLVLPERLNCTARRCLLTAREQNRQTGSFGPADQPNLFGLVSLDVLAIRDFCPLEVPVPEERDGSAVTRRELLKIGAGVVAGAAALDSACAPIALPGKPSGPPTPYDIIIVGTGFGASVAAMQLATACPKAKILMLEKGSYFTSRSRRLGLYASTNHQ